ncbi:MAG: response regulator transcription factor [Bacteroidota bacterium]|nr:response regulator transcription factor [Bacteroidota bacterium]
MELDSNKINIVIVDDHTLFRKGLKGLIKSIDKNFQVIAEYGSGIEIINAMPTSPMPDIITMDMSMDEMDGFETSIQLLKKYPDLKILVISMVQEEDTLIKMLRIGIKGYLSKDVEPNELRNALISVFQKGYYYTDYITGKLVSSINIPTDEAEKTPINFTDKEMQFIKLCCTDLAYKEIAEEMNTSLKSIEYNSTNVFKKMNVKTRIGAVLYAIKHNLVEPF